MKDSTSIIVRNLFNRADCKREKKINTANCTPLNATIIFFVVKYLFMNKFAIRKVPVSATRITTMVITRIVGSSVWPVTHVDLALVTSVHL